jgi:hypothetical protein
MLHRNISVVVIESCSWTTRYNVFAPVFANRVTRPLMVLQCARPGLANRSRARGPNRSFAGAETTLPWLMSAGAYVLLLALGPRLLSDPDTYSQWQTFARHTGFRWSGSRKSHLQEPTQLEVGLASSRADGSRSCDGPRRALRVFADGATHTRAASHPRAIGDGRLDRHIDPRRRHSCRSALACFATDDAVGQSPRQLHVRSGNDCADRATRSGVRSVRIDRSFSGSGSHSRSSR